MAYELLGSGGILDAIQIGNYESYIAEGERGLLELDLRLPVSQSIASQLESQLKSRGIPGVSVRTASPMLQISWLKGFPWLVVIVAAVLALIVLAILIVGWRLYHEVVVTTGGAGGATLLGGGILLLVVAGLAVVLLARRRA